MITSQEANKLADETVAEYAMECGVQSAEDIRNALEMLISKAARGIEKYCGAEAAIEVTVRTSANIAKRPQRPMVKQ